MKPIASINFNGHSSSNMGIPKFVALDDNFCEDCVWCYDNGGDFPCNSSFECDGHAQLGLEAPPIRERQHPDYLSKRVYELDDICEPRLKRKMS